MPGNTVRKVEVERKSPAGASASAVPDTSRPQPRPSSPTHDVRYTAANDNGQYRATNDNRGTRQTIDEAFRQKYQDVNSVVPTTPSEEEEEKYENFTYEKGADQLQKVAQSEEQKKSEEKTDRIKTAATATKTTGAGVQATGSALKTTGKAAEVTGKGAQVAGKGAIVGGRALTSAGIAMSGTGVGAIVGVPTAALGAGIQVAGVGTQAVGKAAEVAGKGMRVSGTAINKTGKGISRAGRGLGRVSRPKDLLGKAEDATLNRLPGKSGALAKQALRFAPPQAKLAVGAAGLVLSKKKVTRANIAVGAYAWKMWIIQLVIASLSLVFLGIAYAQQSAKAAIDEAGKGLLGETAYNVATQVGGVVSTVANPLGISGLALDAALKAFGIDIGSITDPANYFIATYLLVVLIGWATLLLMALTYLGFFINPFFGKHAAAKCIGFLVSMIMYLIPGINIFPWFAVWWITIWLTADAE